MPVDEENSRAATTEAPQVHDASTGFHDIKPLPEFHPSVLADLFYTLGLLAIALLCIWLFLKRSKDTGGKPTSHLSAREELRERLGEILAAQSGGKMPLRVAASEVSIAARRYLERTTKIPAVDLTCPEIERQIDPVLKRSLPVVSVERKEEWSGNCLRLLRQCERLTFSDRSESSASTNPIPRLCDDIQENADTLEKWFRQEEERTRSVTTVTPSTPLEPVKTERREL